MYFIFFFSAIKNIILDPLKAWGLIDTPKPSVNPVKYGLFFPLIILISISCFAGSLIFTNIEHSTVYSIFVAIKCFGSLYLSTYFSAMIFKEITYPLDLGRDFGTSFRIIVYSITPFLLCQIMSSIFESLLFVNILGLYGLYIFWVGIEKILNPPHYKRMPLLIATFIATVGIFIATNLVLTKLIDKLYYAFFD